MKSVQNELNQSIILKSEHVMCIEINHQKQQNCEKKCDEELFVKKRELKEISKMAGIDSQTT